MAVATAQGNLFNLALVVRFGDYHLEARPIHRPASLFNKVSGWIVGREQAPNHQLVAVLPGGMSASTSNIIHDMSRYHLLCFSSLCNYKYRELLVVTKASDVLVWLVHRGAAEQVRFMFSISLFIFSFAFSKIYVNMSFTPFLKRHRNQRPICLLTLFTLQLPSTVSYYHYILLLAVK